MKWLILALAGTVALLVVATVWLGRAAFGDGREMCANEVLSELPSPDREHRAVVFERDCGATTDFSTQVSVLRAAESLPNAPGNLFIADTDHGKAPAGAGGGPEVRLTWMGPRLLRIGHHPDARVFVSNPTASGVSVQYAELRRVTSSNPE